MHSAEVVPGSTVDDRVEQPAECDVNHPQAEDEPEESRAHHSQDELAVLVHYEGDERHKRQHWNQLEA
ncbi:hypothetical protein DVH05_004359 [Phytophthora capsici]|nr:hypothetical protein DVH05_004359 [Phytophthora capsici]